MLKLKIKRRSGADTIPSHVTTLSVSWLNNEFKAVAVHRGTVAGTWARPGQTDGPGNFEGFIREAVVQTGYHGQTVTLLLAHPRLMQQLVDVPPARGAALQKVIQRQAQQQKMFPGEAAWASESLPSAKGMQRVLLHLFPRLLLNQFVQGCKKNGLHLTAVFPPSAVLHHQSGQLPIEKSEVALLAAETSGSTTTVVGRGDGQLLLARTLPGSWSDEAGRVAVDLNRTVLFVGQQYGAASNPTVWLFGPNARDYTDVIQKQLPSPVRSSPVECSPFYWAVEAAKLDPEVAPNFVTTELRKAPQRRTFAKVVGAATALLLIGSLATAAFAYTQAAQNRRTIRLAQGQIAQLESRQQELRKLDDELTRKQEVVKLIIGERPPPAPAWLLAYLGDAVPSDLVITNLEIKRDENLWKLKIAGTIQRAIKTPESVPMEDSVKLLETRLSGAPFYAHFAGNQQKPAAAPGPSLLPGWLGRVSGAQSEADPPEVNAAEPQDHFVIEGVMR